MKNLILSVDDYNIHIRWLLNSLIISMWSALFYFNLKNVPYILNLFCGYIFLISLGIDLFCLSFMLYYMKKVV